MTTSTVDYEEFLAQKHLNVRHAGFSVDDADLHPMLFDWQAAIVRQAVRMGRRFIGIELKQSYFEVACRNLHIAEERFKSPSLFEAVEH